MAVWHSKSDVIDILVMNGIDVDKQNISGYTALHFAAQYCVQGKLFTVSKLLQAKAKIDIKNVDGDTALDLASRYDKRGLWNMRRRVLTRCPCLCVTCGCDCVGVSCTALVRLCVLVAPC